MVESALRDANLYPCFLYQFGDRTGNFATGGKEVHSLQICLSRRSTSPNALFDLKIGERLLLVRLSTLQGGGCVYIHYF